MPAASMPSWRHSKRQHPATIVTSASSVIAEFAVAVTTLNGTQLSAPSKPRRWLNGRARQRYVVEVTVGYTSAGKRIVRRGRGKTKTEARAKLREVMRDREDGLPAASPHATVGSAVTDWLAFGLGSASDATRCNYQMLARAHVIPALGSRKLRDLSAADVDWWLAGLARILSTRTLPLLHSILSRSVNRAMARDLAKRNVVTLCSIPTGQIGRSFAAPDRILF
jgi:hypothetical protein